MKYLIAAVTLVACTTRPAMAQNSFEEAKLKADEIINLIDATNARSPTCTAYEGMIVKPVVFEALMATLPKDFEKGEFETTIQYEARTAAAIARVSKGLVIVGLTPDRDFVKYDVDVGAMLVASGAFGAGKYSKEAGADVSAGLAVHKHVQKGTRVPGSERQRLVRTYTAHNRLGAQYRVSVFDRQTWALHLTNPALFSFAKLRSSPVMAFEVPVANASQVKQSIKLALAMQPLPPYVMSGTLDIIAPTASDPRKINEHSEVLLANAQCALVLSADSRVLAVVDVSQ